jgi:hypothetical protein
VSLKRGFCSYAKLQVFSCYRGCKEAYQTKNALSVTSRRELSSIFSPGKARQSKARQSKARQGKARQGKAKQGKAMQGKAPKEIHAILR